MSVVKEKIAYIDVAKGMLMLCLLWGHQIIELRMHGVENSTLEAMWKLVPLYNAFFMQTFFIITGLCSSFNVRFSSFLWKNIKTLVIPAIIITAIGFLGTDINNHRFIPLEHAKTMFSWLYTQGGPWFIFALFWAKILYWPIYRLDVRYQAVIVAILYFLGMTLNQFKLIPDIQWHQHALMMMPYLFMGNLLKNHMAEVDRYLDRIALAAAIILPIELILNFSTGYTIPMSDRNIFVYFNNFYIHFINVILGTAGIFWLARKWQNCKPLQTFGAGSLLIYLINEPQQRFVLKFMMPLHGSDMHPVLAGMFDISVYAACVALFYIVVKVVYGNKYLSYMLGKW